MNTERHLFQLPTLNASRLDRREWLKRNSRWFAYVSLAAAGCRPASTVPSPASRAKLRTDVPLRVVWFGRSSDGPTIERIRQSVSEQAISVQVIPAAWTGAEIGVASLEPATTSLSLLNAAEQADVVVAPLIQLSELVAREIWMPIPESTGEVAVTDDNELRVPWQARLPPALRVAATWGDRLRGCPIGGHLPVLAVSETTGTPTLTTWRDVEQFAADHPGRYAEPTAPMWAAAMFLWRAASSIETTWLFDRQSLRPLIVEQEYVAVLTQMKSTADASRQRPMSPGDVWQAVTVGTLDGGIGFPNLPATPDQTEAANASAMTLLPLPRGRVALRDSEDQTPSSEPIRRQMLDPFSLVATLSSACRQTTAATQFIDWLAGGEGSGALVRALPQLIDNPVETQNSAGAPADYATWWRGAVQSPSLVPSIPLLSAMRYYESLDTAVRRCLTSDLTPQQACDQVETQWLRLHQEIGLKTQQRTWQRALGLIG